MEKLKPKEKLSFITRNGWIIDKNTSHGGRYRKKEWDVADDQHMRSGYDVYQAPYIMRNESLDTAYELEMEAEYDRLTIMLRDAKKIMLSSNNMNKMTEWLVKYKEWSEI